jgi:hypothetical protein
VAALLCLIAPAGAGAAAPHARKTRPAKARRAVKCKIVMVRIKPKHPARRHQKVRRVRVRVCSRVHPKAKKKHASGTKKPTATAPNATASRAPSTPTSTATLTATSTASWRLIDADFFGQHLENFPSWPGILTPPWHVQTIRLWDAGVKWCDLNPAPGQYNWAHLDSWLQYATETGADLVYTFGGTPGWAVPGGQGGCGAASNEAPDATAWQSFVSALVQHANGRIKYFELWNEWDWSYFWAGGVPTMVAMAEQAASVIHGAHEGLELLTPSITPYDGNNYLESFLQALPPSSGTIDVVAVHTYTQSSKGQGLWPEDTLYQFIFKVRSAMQNAGYGAYPLWSTEGGWGDNSWFGGYSDPASQRAFVARYDLVLLSLGLSRAYWYAYGNPSWGTLWTSSGLTPAGTATGTLLDWLVGATLTGPCGKDGGGLWTCDLTRPNGYRARILWVQAGSRSVPTPSGYTTLRTLSGGSAPAPSALSVSIEPVLIEN